MVFSSLIFIFRFLPIVLGIYYLVPYKLKNFVLLIASLFFYSWGEAKYFVIMLACIVVNYSVALIIEANRTRAWLCRLMLIVSLVVSLGMLFFFKYTNFFIGNINALFGTSFDTLKNIVMPLGISFYTFQTLSYTVDVYRGKVKADKNFIRVGAFVTLFPQLIAGPIVLYTDVDKELKSRRLSLMQIQEGVRIFIFGLGKKVLIANNVGALWDEVVRLGFANVSAPLAWLGIIAFSLQIYFDFSGYSQMAIGLGKMLGFNFPDNFNLPYISKSMTEFWRRWHITLGAWFREYLYIPLGGNRCKPARMYFNLFVVWFCTGFWHGASWNFIIWGMFFYVLIVIERATGFKSWLDKSRVVSHIYVVVLLILSWSIFAIEDLGQIGLFWSRLFSFQPGMDALYYLHNYAFSIVVAIICSTPLIVKLYKHIQKHRWLDNLVLMSITVLSVAYLVDASYNPFLYFRF